MYELAIEVAENGFVVFESAGQGVLGKKWAFETAETLALFIEAWGNDKEVVQQ
tara:strand:- start:17346 stop:17504 length:159 start_codon:yes stop_codon:yes gene_type:complete